MPAAGVPQTPGTRCPPLSLLLRQLSWPREPGAAAAALGAPPRVFAMQRSMAAGIAGRRLRPRLGPAVAVRVTAGRQGAVLPRARHRRSLSRLTSSGERCERAPSASRVTVLLAYRRHFENALCRGVQCSCVASAMHVCTCMYTCIRVCTCMYNMHGWGISCLAYLMMGVSELKFERCERASGEVPSQSAPALSSWTDGDAHQQVEATSKLFVQTQRNVKQETSLSLSACQVC